MKERTVIAIIITIMVLELKVPHGAGFDALMPLAPILGSYVLSFIYVGIFWNKLQYASHPSNISVPRLNQPFLRLRISPLSKLTVGLITCLTLSSASADEFRDKGDQAFKAGKYARAYAAWLPGADAGDSEQQELIANLLLGPHARAVKHDRYEGTRFLYRAAIGGRRTAMLSLSDAINKGSFGLKRVPAAAECWSKAPSSIGERGVCVGLTDFDAPRARASCSELPSVKEQDGTNKANGVASAKLCLANKTPALLVPGPPPSAEDIQRWREYARHGIEWQITGDVYEEDFEHFREKFNATIIEGIEAKHGRGYLERLSKEIDARIMRSKR